MGHLGMSRGSEMEVPTMGYRGWGHYSVIDEDVDNNW